MIVSIDSADSGWDGYTLGMDGEREHARFVSGDIEYGNYLCERTNYANGQYLRLVISFYDDVSEEKGEEIVKEFLDLFYHGYRSDELHTDIVEHTDTKFKHYHVRTAKVNTLTGNQAHLFWHKSDTERKIAIMDYLILKAEYHNVNGTLAVLRMMNPEGRAERWHYLATKITFAF